MSDQQGYDDEGYDEGSFEASLTTPDYAPAAGYPQSWPDPNVLAATLTGEMTRLAQAAVEEKLSGPLGQVAEYAHQNEMRQLSAMADAATAAIEEKIPGADLHSPEFHSFLENWKIDGNSQQGIERGLEDAYRAFDAVKSQRDHTESRRQISREWSKILNADDGRWRGTS